MIEATKELDRLVRVQNRELALLRTQHAEQLTTLRSRDQARADEVAALRRQVRALQEVSGYGLKGAMWGPELLGLALLLMLTGGLSGIVIVQVKRRRDA